MHRRARFRHRKTRQSLRIPYLTAALATVLGVFLAIASSAGVFATAPALSAGYALTSQDAATILPVTQVTAAASAAADKSMLAAAKLARAAAEAVLIYTVRPGDTLSRVAVARCGTARDWTGIYAASRARGLTSRNADVLTPGQHLYLACAYVPSMAGRAQGTPVVLAAHVTSTSTAHSSHRSENPAAYHGGVFSYTGLEALWESAGGSRSTAAVAACIAEHESGGNPAVISPTDDWGLWQIHAGGYAMLNPYANVRRAVAMSSDGTNWNPWSTKYDCV